MAEEPNKEPPKIVDFDAGEDWGKRSVALDHPFRLGGVVYRSIELRTPSGLDLARWRNSQSTLFDFTVALSTLDVKVFNTMHGKDLAKVLAAANDFLS